MKTATARKFAEQLLHAVFEAEADGRDTLDVNDLDVFAEADDEAREALVAAIEAAG